MVGQSEREGLSEGWPLGAVLLDGDSDGIEDGSPDTDGASLGNVLGWDEGCDEGLLDKLGLSLG